MKSANEYNKILWSVIIVFIISILISLIVLLDYSDSLKVELAYRDTLIENLNKKDSILQESIKVVDTIRNGNSDVNISQLVKYANSLSDENVRLYKRINLLNDSIRYYKVYFDWSQKYFNHKYVVNPNVGGGKNYSIEPNAVRKELLEKCQMEYRKSVKEIMNLRNQIKEYQCALKWYGIELNTKKGNEATVFPSPYYAPKIDSALMLLEVYRDKLKYNEKNKSWEIGNRAIFTTQISTVVKVDTISIVNPQATEVRVIE